MAKKLPTTFVFEIMENSGVKISRHYKNYLKEYINKHPEYKKKLDEERYYELANDMVEVLSWRYDLDYC